MANIAIFGGTFNPFHIGHYQMLKSICELDFVDKVLVMPDKIPPHKECDFIVDDVHRQTMCKLACSDFTKAELCLIEFEREGKSYTVDTIKLLRKKNPDDNFFVVVGGDMLSMLDSWYNWQELFSLTAFIAFKRKGIKDFNSHYDRITSLGAKVTTIDADITEVSSTQLRKNLDKNLLPIKIYEYINQEEIYNV